MVAFAIGDSVTNPTPMNAWFVLALGFVQQFRKGAGIGTVLSFTVPIGLTVLVSWSPRRPALRQVRPQSRTDQGQ
ncbi:AbgT family transporter [Streptomyces collinus]|uniref:AbgT family transporter n=1 Tax=Streptomyces collinus TaxID=42684 RepID=UPI00379CAF7D